MISIEDIVIHLFFSRSSIDVENIDIAATCYLNIIIQKRHRFPKIHQEKMHKNSIQFKLRF